MPDSSSSFGKTEEGIFLAFTPTPSGGFTLEIWNPDSSSWLPFEGKMGVWMDSRPTAREILKAKGIPLE